MTNMKQYEPTDIADAEAIDEISILYPMIVSELLKVGEIFPAVSDLLIATWKERDLWRDKALKLRLNQNTIRHDNRNQRKQITPISYDINPSTQKSYNYWLLLSIVIISAVVCGVCATGLMFSTIFQIGPAALFWISIGLCATGVLCSGFIRIVGTKRNG